eukprot:GGOE01005126.1.p1 GENE.GGOE01005126.1~~GGOE01005126.1.p1  ORF type:complete len:1250 (-),score=391.07 GGOE01005126.1:716-4441(-)
MNNAAFQGAPSGLFVGSAAPRLFRTGLGSEFDHYGTVPLPRPNPWDFSPYPTRPRQPPHLDKPIKGRSKEQQRIERELEMLRELQASRERDLQRCVEQGSNDWSNEDDIAVALGTALRLLQGGVQCSDSSFTSLQMICEAVGYALTPLTDYPTSSEARLRRPEGRLCSPPFVDSFNEARKERLLDAATTLLQEMGDPKKLNHVFIAKASELLSADMCSVFLLHGDVLTDAITGQTVPCSGILGSVVSTRKAVNTQTPESHLSFDQRIDSTHVTAYLCLPIIHAGAVKGAARVLRHGYGIKRPFTQQDEYVLGALVSLAGAALHFASELQSLTKQAARLESELLMSKQLSGDTLNCGALVRTLMEHTRHLTGADHCSFYLVEVAKGWMFAYHGNLGTACVTLDSGIAGHVARTAGLVNLVDACNDPRYSPATDCQGVQPRSMLCAAILFEGKAVAVVQLANKWGGEAFTAEDEEAVLTYGQFAGSIIHNSHAFEGVQMQRNKAAMILAMVRPLGVAELIPERLVALIVENARHLTGAEKCCLFLMNATATSLQGCVGVDKKVTLQLGNSIPGQVAAHGFAINCARACDHPSFNPKIDRDLAGYEEQSIFCAPICSDECVLAVVLLLNKLGDRQFTAEDEDTFAVYANFAGTALRNCRVHDSLKVAKRKNDVLVDVLGKLSQTNLRKVDEIIEKVITGAQELLNAERCSLFMVDKERNELYSRVASHTGGKEIRFRMTQGIAGEVARTQIPLNIKNVYTDPRFNSEIDRQFSFKTHSILAFPVVREGETVAVAQLVNKQGSGIDTGFTKEDEEIMEYFAMFSGISLANAKMLEFAVASSANAMRLMGSLHGSDVRKKSYDAQLGSPGHVHDYKHALATPIPLADIHALQFLPITPEELEAVRRYDFDIHQYKSNELRPRMIPLLVSLFDHYGCIEQLGVDRTTLYRFFIRVQLLYRTVPYHNWFHAADVVQTMFLFIETLEPTGVFTVLDKFILLLSGALHDMDHMGLNNSFYLKTETPMGILVNCTGSLSVLEVHHCNLAIEVLSDPQTNVFHCLTAEQQTYAFKALVNVILATDMAKHGEISKAFKELPTLQEDTVVNDHKLQFMKMLIKSCDVSNVIKPFDVARVWAVAVTEEFYTQGDMEKERGFDILPMFDRQKADLAKGQIGFIDFLASHQFTAMVDWYPGFEWAREGYKRTRVAWQSIIDAEAREKAEQEERQKKEKEDLETRDPAAPAAPAAGAT